MPAQRLDDTARAALQDTRTPEWHPCPGFHTGRDDLSESSAAAYRGALCGAVWDQPEHAGGPAAEEEGDGALLAGAAEASACGNSEPGTAPNQGFPSLMIEPVMVFSF